MISATLQDFWRQHPALLYGLTLLLGLSIAFSKLVILSVPVLLLMTPLLLTCRDAKNLWRFCLASLLLLMTFFWASSVFQKPVTDEEGIPGTAYVNISSLSSGTTPFGKRWVYRGTLSVFEPHEASAEQRAYNVPINISLPQKEGIFRPQANCAYIVAGRLKETMSGRFALKVNNESAWYPVVDSWSWAENRFQAKQAVITYIHHHIADPRAARFLAGIATGDFDDRTMLFELSRFGVQHIMAISGFHFAIIASILSLLLRFILSQKIANAMLAVLLTGYFIFLGCSASVLRAWMTALLVLAGFLLEKQGSGLNFLGAALLVVLLIDPQMYQQLGFQFSFATTAAILILYRPFDQLLQHVLIRRPLHQMVEMDRLNQHGYCVLIFFRRGLALTCAINAVALPLTLYYFHQFPLMSLIYNLFFPFLVSIAMLLLILSMLFVPINPLSEIMHALNNQFTQFVLNFTYHLPTSIDIIWRTPSISAELVIFSLSLVFFLGIFFTKYQIDPELIWI